MDTETECNCCPPKACVTCLPQCSSRPYVSFRNRVERPLKYEGDCGRKNCRIFGRHDAAPLSEYQGHPKLLKTKDDNKNLGSPIGLVTSNVNFKAEAKGGDIIKARYATYLKAFARLHLNDEKEWDSQLLDDIMAEGLNLYTSSQNKQSPVTTVATDIYMAHEQEVLREFELSGFTFQVELMPKFKPLATKCSELGGQGDGLELTLEDIVPALRSFLRQHKYGLLKAGTFYTMIWRSREAYFVFDVCGRRLTDFQVVKENGLVMLMCFKSLENIRHLIHHLSGLQTTEPFMIRELKLVKVLTPQGNIMQLDYSLRNHQYEIVNDDYAYLRSDLHLTLNKTDLLRNRSALPVAVTAIVVSKIDHPATWDLKMVDKIICFGVNLCQALWMKCKSTEPIDVNVFPTTFTLGQFHINIEIKAQLYQGKWHCVPAFKHSELANVIKKAFNDKHHKLILQIGYQIYAIWKKQEFIYLLDPYRHRIMGKQNESKVYAEMEKSASVRMLRDFEMFMNVLNHILLDSNRTSDFYLHTIKVKNIQPIHKEKPGHVTQIKEPQHDDYGEILSINEHICFEEAEDLCKATLGEISDYEDDDLRSDVVEIELRTSSSEEELLEEEAGAGEVGEIEDVETSSSGEEGGGHKNNFKGNKELGKGNKQVKRKQTKKGGHNRNKKGKETNDNELGDDGNNIKISGENEKSKNSDKAQDMGKEKAGNKNSSKNKDSRKEDTKKEKDLHKEKDENKDKELNKTKDLNQTKDKQPSKDNDAIPMKDRNKEKEQPALNEKEHKTISKDKTLSGDKDISKDNNLSKTLVEQKDGNSINKTNEEDQNKSDLDKSKNSVKDTNKENEIFQTAHKFVDEQDLTKDEEIAKETQKNKTGLKERTEKLEKHDKNHNDGTEADDENDECLEKRVCSTPNPNRYPGYFKYPADMAVLGSESGSYESICKLFQAGFKVADRLLLMTTWGNFVIFRCAGQTGTPQKHYYYLFDGCTCNFKRFRHFDLAVGTAGLICFEHVHNIIEYIRHLRRSRTKKKPPQLSTSADDICKEYCNKSFVLRV